jgi:hypothetical protein
LTSSCTYFSLVEYFWNFSAPIPGSGFRT